MNSQSAKKYLFEQMPLPRTLAKMAIPTIVSQLVNLIYNLVDTFFIGRTGNSYMVAATTVTLTLTMLNVAFSNIFGIGGGSLMARLLGKGEYEMAKRASAFSCIGAAVMARCDSALIAATAEPVLYFLGASDATIGFAKAYTMLVIVIGSLPAMLAMTIAHLLRNAGFSSQASFGLSMGGVLNIFLDPLFMFVIMPKGYEVVGAAAATLLSNVIACGYLLQAYRKASASASLSLSRKDAAGLEKRYVKELFSVGVPSGVLTGLFDLASICANILAAAHSDLVLAGLGIVMKVERLPNAINIGLCQGMLPIVAYNYASGNHQRMRDTIHTARLCGLAISALCILLLEFFAYPVTHAFLATSTEHAEIAIATVGFAAVFLRIRCLAAPVQFLNYHTSFCMQAIGRGKETMLHAVVRELGFYIPFMFLLDRLFGQNGLASALPIGEACGAIFALILLRHILKQIHLSAKEF